MAYLSRSSLHRSKREKYKIEKAVAHARARARVFALLRGEPSHAECRSDFERICLRDEARAVKAAALILGRRDIATEAAIFIAEAERVIVQANPPDRPQEAGPSTW